MDIRNIVTINTKEEIPTISVDNVLLHSKYYPCKESEKFLDSNEHIFKNKGKVVVYGLAMGYHIQALLQRIEMDCIVYVFDADKEIVDIGNKLNLYKTLKDDKRVKLFTGTSESFYNEFYKRVNEVEDILIYKPSVKVMPKNLDKLKMILQGYDLAKVAIERFGQLMEENYQSNIKNNKLFIEEFFETKDFKNSTIVVAASGPSLDYNIEAIKRLSGKVKIFVVGSALRTFINNGIKPDMVAIIDSQEIVKNQLRDFENLDIPLCYLNTASRWAVDSYKGPKYMFFNSNNEHSNISINTGKTVAVSALDIAIKAGASKIVLIGQDLAFINNKTHTESFLETYNMDNSVPKDDSVYKKTLGVDGTMLNTTEGFLYFKHCIERLIEQNPQLQFINCSKGARIKGTRECILEESVI